MFTLWTARGATGAVVSGPDDEVRLPDLALATNVLSNLGYDYHRHGHFEVPIAEFLAVGHKWLRQHIDRMSPGLPASAGRDRLPVGWLNCTIHRLVLMAQQGKACGATHVVGL
jgi:hypothetical protein